MRYSTSKAGVTAAKQTRAPLLAGFETLEEYRAPRESVFPTLASLRWVLIEYRRELLDADALRQHRGRVLLHGERADQVIDQATKAAAVRRYEAIAAVLSEDDGEVVAKNK